MKNLTAHALYLAGTVYIFAQWNDLIVYREVGGQHDAKAGKSYTVSPNAGTVYTKEQARRVYHALTLANAAPRKVRVNTWQCDSGEGTYQRKLDELAA